METKESTMQNGDESTYPDLHNSSRMPSTTSFNTTPPALYIEELSENDGTTAIEITPGEDVEEIVGFSIGQEQLRMKSPQTPAFEKAKVLDQSKDYLDVAPDDVEFSEYDAGLEKFPEPEEESVPHKALDNEESERPNGKSSPAAMPTPDASRSNASKSILKGAFVPRTRRASSGSINMVNTLKKLLPDLPSISLPKAPVLPTLGFGSKSKGETDVNRAKRSSTLFSRGSLPWISFTQSTHPETTAGNKEQSLAKENNSQREISLPGNNDANIRSAPGDSGGNVHQSNMPSRTALNPHLLKRYTSENSLFMRHDLERTSTQDDADKWGHVSEQINSRFKAITDSFQDSAMTRLPKMPSVNLASFKPGPLRSNSDNTRLNTHRNMAMAHADTPTHDRIQNTPSPQTDDQTKHAHPILNKAISDLTGDVVVLGGYRGSILRSAKPPHKQLWVPVKVGINLRRVDLEVGLNAEDEERMTDTIIPSGVLSHIGPVDICRRLLRHLKKSSRARPDLLRVHNYGYDWRLSPHLLSQQLIKFLESLRCNQVRPMGPGRGAVVIAHSLGGLITRHAVNQRPDLFSGVIYAGVPQHCVNILGPLRNGDDVLLSSRVLTAQVNFTLRTSYVLLPESGRCFINKVTGERYDLDFFNVKTWEDNCLSPCVANVLPRPEQRKTIMSTLSDSLPSLSLTNKWKDDIKDAAKDSAYRTAQKAEEPLSAPSGQPLELSMESSQPMCRESIATACTIPRADAIAYLDRTLKQVLQFKQETAFNPSHQEADVYPPIAVLHGSSVPTVFAARVESREAIKRADAYDDLAFAAGDGVVLSKAAKPPEGYKIVKGGLVGTERGHIGLLGDLEAVGKCLQAIIDARRRGVGTGAFARKEATGAL